MRKVASSNLTFFRLLLLLILAHLFKFYAKVKNFFCKFLNLFLPLFLNFLLAFIIFPEFSLLIVDFLSKFASIIYPLDLYSTLLRNNLFMQAIFYFSNFFSNTFIEFLHKLSSRFFRLFSHLPVEKFLCN